jgi:hypothetical protein
MESVSSTSPPCAASYPRRKILAPTSLLLQYAEALNSVVETQRPRNVLGGGGSDGSAAKDARSMGYTPVSRTPITTSVAPPDAWSNPDDSERCRNDGVSVVCSYCITSGSTARTAELREARCAACAPVSRAANPVAACAYE